MHPFGSQTSDPSTRLLIKSVKEPMEPFTKYSIYTTTNITLSKSFKTLKPNSKSKAFLSLPSDVNLILN